MAISKKSVAFKDSSKIAKIDTFQSKSEQKPLFILGLFVTTLIILVTLIIVYLSVKGVAPSVAEPRQVVVSQQAPEEQKIFDSTLLKIELLNGAGVRGAAGKASEKLSQKGLSVENIGNADLNTYKTSEFYLSAEFDEFKDEVTDQLREEFPSIEYKGVFENESGVNMQIILGRQDAI